MKYICFLKQLQNNIYYKTVENELAHIIYNEIKNNKRVLYLEEGDLLRGIEAFGINYSTGGVLGLKIKNVKFYDDYISCNYKYENEYITLIVKKKICDNEILGLFELYK